jgi:hypothetical protein
MNTENLIRQFSEAPKSPEFEVKSVVDRESYDMIYRSGSIQMLNDFHLFVAQMGANTPHLNQLEIYTAIYNWIDQQRKTLNKYL